MSDVKRFTQAEIDVLKSNLKNADRPIYSRTFVELLKTELADVIYNKFRKDQWNVNDMQHWLEEQGVELMANDVVYMEGIFQASEENRIKGEQWLKDVQLQDKEREEDEKQNKCLD